MSRTEMPAPICWTVKRNCSASPAQLAAVFASIVGLSFIFGIAFAVQGMWLILPFVGLELVAVAVAFLCYGRRAADYERITLSERDLSIERIEGARATRWRFPTPWTTVELEEAGDGWMRSVRVFVVSRAERVEVGRHLAAPGRAALAHELSSALRGMVAA
jgi:uncharacterized membrane protein